MITKNLRWLQWLQAIHTEVPGINNLGNLLSSEQQLPELKTSGVLTQIWHRTAPHTERQGIHFFEDRIRRDALSALGMVRLAALPLPTGERVAGVKQTGRW